MFSGVSFLSVLLQINTNYYKLCKPLQKQHPFFFKRFWLMHPWFKQTKHRLWLLHNIFLTSMPVMTEHLSDQWSLLHKTQVSALFSDWLYNADAEPKQYSDIKLSFLPIRSLLYSQFSRAVISNFKRFSKIPQIWTKTATSNKLKLVE